MIESVMVDEVRARLDEQVARSQFKTAPVAADEHVASLLSRVSRPVRGAPQGSLSLARARRMASDAEEFDTKAAKGRLEAET